MPDRLPRAPISYAICTPPYPEHIHIDKLLRKPVTSILRGETIFQQSFLCFSLASKKISQFGPFGIVRNVPACRTYPSTIIQYIPGIQTAILFSIGFNTVKGPLVFWLALIINLLIRSECLTD